MPHDDKPEARPGGLLPDADAIDRLVIQAAETLAIYRSIGRNVEAIVEELREMFDLALLHGGVTVTLRPTGEFVLTIPFPKE